MCVTNISFFLSMFLLSHRGGPRFLSSPSLTQWHGFVVFLLRHLRGGLADANVQSFMIYPQQTIENHRKTTGKWGKPKENHGKMGKKQRKTRENDGKWKFTLW